MATKREPKDLSHEELVGLVEGLRETMYADIAGDKDIWNPDQHVSGSDLVDWVHEEFRALGLIPEAGPREPVSS